MPTKKKETKPAAKKAKAPKAAAKKSPALKAWERRTYLYEKQQSGKPLPRPKLKRLILFAGNVVTLCLDSNRQLRYA